MAKEIEIKLAFPDTYAHAALSELSSALKSLGIAAGFQESRLENAYFDTSDFRLNAHKVALRIRRKQNNGQASFIQTLKTAGQSKDGLSQRGEWEWPLEQNELDLENLRACEGWPADLAATSLQKVFETNFTRHTCELAWGNSLIELVLDWGEVASQGASARIHEIELELKQGQAQDLLDFSACLRKQLPVTPLDISKAERGFKLFQSSVNGP